MHARLVLLELLVLASSVGCKQAPEGERQQAAIHAVPSVNELTRLIAPRGASRFHPLDGVARSTLRFHRLDGTLRQDHPRLPDTGEWRCAEQGKVVWCAGGQAAAGVVSGPPDPRYRCGPRWGNADERVCIDEHPDYPGQDGSANGAATHDVDVHDLQCRFEQEQGIARVCELGAPNRNPALPAHALPACWLGRDCPTGHCERGACGCRAPADCTSGRCSAGVCVEAAP